MNAALAHQQLFSRLEGLYYALTLAVQDPVVIPNSELDKSMQGAVPFDLSKVYFYVEEEQGEELLRARISSAAADIVRAYRSHQKINETFLLMEQHSRRQEKKEFTESTTALCTAVDAYALFVTDHRQRLGEKAFLEYPRFTDQHLSYRQQKKSKLVRGISEGNLVQLAVLEKIVDSRLSMVPYFNPEGSLPGMVEELQQFRRLLSDMSSYQGALWSEMYTGHPDCSYPKRIELTRMLLREHGGLEVEHE